MDEPQIGRYPTEVFGHAYSEFSAGGEARAHLEAEHCPFIGGRCKKVRKSDPDTRLGTCSVGYDGGRGAWTPSVICPYRLHVPGIFDTVRRMAFGDAPALRLAEVPMCVGTFDFVLARCDGGRVEDFCALEMQAGDTTGAPWDAVADLKDHGRYRSAKYEYGLNMARQYQKTAMQQMYKKGRVMESWRKHIVMVLQGTGIEYLRRSPASDASGLVENSGMDMGNSGKFIHFAPFTMSWSGGRWEPAITGMYDTDSAGVANLLGAPPSGRPEKLEEFVAYLNSRLGDSVPVERRSQPVLGQACIL